MTTHSAIIQTDAMSEWQAVARRIEHTLLRPEVTRGEISQICEEATYYGREGRHRDWFSPGRDPDNGQAL